MKKPYVSEIVLQSYPWLPETKEELEVLLSHILFMYRRVVVAGDEDLAKDQLRSQLREKVVVDRETVWSQMVSGHRSQGVFRSVELQTDDAFEVSAARYRWTPSWMSTKMIILILAFIALVVIVQVQPFRRPEESNCLAMLVFCTILWATEVRWMLVASSVILIDVLQAIPLFVTSLAVPLLVVFLRVLRSSDGEDIRMTAADSTKYTGEISYFSLG